MTETWTKERFTLMAEMHAQGYRNKDIREALNKLPGPPLTKGSFEGMYWRNYSRKQTAAERKAVASLANLRKREKRAKDKLNQPPKPKPQRTTPFRKPPISRPWFRCSGSNVIEFKATASRKTILEVGPRECRWPDDDLNEKGLHTFCGRRTYDGSSYCERHENMSRGEGTISERAAHKVSRRDLA